MSSTRSIFFDLDGTLTDPYEGIHRCIDFALESLGEHVRDDYRWCVGPPLLESFVELVGEDRAETALTLYRERYADVGWSENTPYDGISNTLAALKARGHKLYVATSKPHTFANRILEHFRLSGLFTTVYGAELDGTRGDKPSLLAYALANEDRVVSPVMVGDRRFDIEGAKANSMEAWGVIYGYGDQQELSAAGADRLVSTVEELKRLQ